MMDSAAALRRLGLKLTPQRMAILGYIEGNESHPSAGEVFQALRADHPSMALATVYNTLRRLVEAGLLLEIRVARGQVNYDPDTSIHDHAYCTRCGRIFDLPPDRSRPPEKGPRGFRVEAERRILYGRCRDCAGKEDAR
jgi:Fur family peroxide stress response transcriptional regulator